MSNSPPKSPRSPRSKSPSFADGKEVDDLNDIQSSVRDELRSRSTARSMTTRGPSSNYAPQNAYSRASQHPGPRTSTPSRIPSARGTYDDVPRMPSPPLSPITYGSRNASPEQSKRGSRGPSPVASAGKSKATFYDDNLYDEEGRPLRSTSQYPQGASERSVRKSPGPSQNFMRQTPNQSQTTARGAAMRSDAALRNYLSVGTSAITFGNLSRISHANQTSFISSSAMNRNGSEVDYDGGYDVPGIGLSTSGLSGMGVDATTSAMTYGIGRDRSMMAGEGSLMPVCSTFMDNPSNTPYGLNQQEMDGQVGCGGQPPAQGSYSGAGCGGQPPAQAGYSGAGCGGQQPAQGGYSGAGCGGQPPAQGGYSGAGCRGTGPQDRRMMPPPPEYPPSTGFGRPPMPGGSADFPNHDHHHHSEGPDMPGEMDEKVKAALGHLFQLKKTPSYSRCGLNQGLDFLKVCSPKPKDWAKCGKATKFPEIPCLRQEDIDELVKCETQDVESTWLLTSEERRTYKKPCPKQQKAQMSVKALMQAHAAQTCPPQKEYFPLEHPDPEDISPEVAAAMMFSQERGVKLEDCPQYTISSLFPDEPRPPFPEKDLQSNISIVDRKSKDQDEMIEKSATVPSEGVSDSAYTRTMKEKGEDIGAQKSFDVDFAIGQSKREYILVAQKPQRINKVQFRGGNSPPWFPGYFTAFPDDEGLQVVSSPSRVFHKAWIHSNPGNIPSSDVIVLD